MKQITKELRDYLDGLRYDFLTHRWLMEWADKKGLRDTPEYRRWADETAECCVAFQTGRNELREMYPDGFDVPAYDENETWPSSLTRMYPRENLVPIHMGGTHAKSITMQVTEDCNMACTYCYQHNKTHKRMDLDTAKRFIDYILGDSSIGPDPYLNPMDSDGVILDFIGGEPLLEIELIDQICDYFVERCFLLHHPFATRFMFSFSSNGLLYFQPAVQSYLDKFGMHVSFSISIDGNKELHDACRVDLAGNGTYDRAMAAARHYMDVRKGKLGSKITIAPGNVSYTFDAVKAMIEAGYTDIHANCVFEEGWTVEHARILYREMIKLADYLVTLPEIPHVSLFEKFIGQPIPEEDDRNWCGGAGLMLAVNHKGELFPCLRYMESSVGGEREPYTIGDIAHGVCNKERLHCLECITRRSQSTEECFRCPIASGCAWCSAYNYQVFGTPNKRATFICVMHKARVLANEYYWQKRGEDYHIDIPDDWREEILNGDNHRG